jgi:3-deoxy-7-phosphoheptulonate synthase
VTQVALGAVASGADGLIIEVHHKPDEAMSDGRQSLTFDQFADLMRRVRGVAQAVDRTA